MSRRIEIELTSNKGDGTWTWRAAGAREPRGLISADMIPKGAGISSVFTAEVQSDMDGIAVLAVIETEDTRTAPETIEVLGTGKRSSGVNFKGGGRRRGKGRGDNFGSGGFGGDGFGQGQPRQKQQGGRRKGGSRGAGQDRPARLRPARVHRKKWLASVPPEHAALAEQIASGRGIANEKGGVAEMGNGSERGGAAEKGGAEENNSASENGAASEKNSISEGGNVAERDSTSKKGGISDKDVAAKLLSEYRMAEWRDRADLVLSNFEKIDLAEIRMLVADADVCARTPETRSQAEEARQKLGERTERQHGEWLADLATNLSEGRVLRALRMSGQPPKAGVPLPLDLVKWLATATADILTPEAQPDRWEITLQALAVSPVRRLVRPSQPPAVVSPDLTEAVKELSPRFPQIAALFLDEADAEEEGDETEEEASEEGEDAETKEGEALESEVGEAEESEEAEDAANSQELENASGEEQQEQPPETKAEETETAEAAETPEAEEPAI